MATSSTNISTTGTGLGGGIDVQQFVTLALAGDRAQKRNCNSSNQR